MAEATAQLLDREDRLATFDVFHFGGHWLGRADELGASIRRVTHKPRLPIRSFPYALIYALAPFVETFREMIEMRYLWIKPIGLDNTKLVRFLGAEPHTPLDVAMRATLADMGCLGEIELESGFGAAVAALTPPTKTPFYSSPGSGLEPGTSVPPHTSSEKGRCVRSGSKAGTTREDGRRRVDRPAAATIARAHPLDTPTPSALHPRP